MARQTQDLDVRGEGQSRADGPMGGVAEAAIVRRPLLRGHRGQHEKEGKPFVEAAIEAARLRFRPILMTTLSFVLGMIPLVLASGAGARSRVSLGTAVFGGMLIYTILGVFFIPVLYAAVELTWSKLFRRKPAEVEPAGGGAAGSTA